jgi:ribosomal protein L37E
VTEPKNTPPGKAGKKKFSLVENARDSLEHAVAHLTTEKNPSHNDLKIALLDVARVVELLLKERLRSVHPAFLWVDVEKYPSADARTVGAEATVTRLQSVAGVVLPEAARRTIRACRRIRNSVEHFEFEMDVQEVKSIVGRMLSFIFDFTKHQLSLDFETDFRKDNRWSKLVEIYDFWSAHAEALGKELEERGEETRDCPRCGASTFVISESQCALCGRQDQLVTCGQCGHEVWESETETLEGEAYSDSDNLTICQNCIGRAEYEDMAYEMWKDR